MRRCVFCSLKWPSRCLLCRPAFCLSAFSVDVIVLCKWLVDWRIQGGEVYTKHSRPVAIPVLAKTTDDIARTAFDHPQSLDHTSIVDQQHESDRPRRRSLATIETFVSFYCGEGVSHLQLRIEALVMGCCCCCAASYMTHVTVIMRLFYYFFSRPLAQSRRLRN